MKNQKQLYKTLAVALMLPAMAISAFAKDVTGPVVTNPGLERNGDSMTAALTLNLANADVKSNGIVVYEPFVANGPDTLFLPSVGVYGRTRWIQNERRDGKPYKGEYCNVAMRYKKDMAPLQYAETFPYQEWMNGSELQVKMTDYGCAGCEKGYSETDALASYRHVDYVPTFYFMEATGNVEKTAELSGRAYVEFKVNKTDILPDYKNNSKELGKIFATIDSVKNDNDITVTSISIKGTASPDGPYENNVRLAQGRTESLKDYVQKLYHFPPNFIKTSFEPVDWQGLKDFLNGDAQAPTSDKANLSEVLPHRAEILAIVEGDLEPFQKNQKIKTTYPKEYAWLLENIYPSLRHSDYKIEYTIRSFTQVSEIEEMLRVAPQKLNLNEMYFLASSYKPGSDKYNQLYETAVRMFPNDETANLNAANAAMQKGDMAAAAKYLANAGNSAKATYARGVFEALNGNLEKGLELVNKAIAQGAQVDAAVLQNLQDAVNYR